jgi:hypothetical protein
LVEKVSSGDAEAVFISDFGAVAGWQRASWHGNAPRRTFLRDNEDDESTFTAKLTPSQGKLDLNVNFYDRGLFPPGAYHHPKERT